MTKMKLLSILLGVYGSVLSQGLTDLKGDYLGQAPPGETPQVFARGIVSDQYQQHGVPSFSPDGNEVFWQTNRLDSAGQWDISVMAMRRTGDQWSAPERTSYGSGPVFSPDGKRLYLGSAGQGEDPCYMEKQGENWSGPKRIALVSRFPELKYAFNLSIAAKRHALSFSVAPKAGGSGTISAFTGRNSATENTRRPELLPPSVNAPGGVLNWTPFIPPDESALLFCSRQIRPRGRLRRPLRLFPAGRRDLDGPDPTGRAHQFSGTGAFPGRIAGRPVSCSSRGIRPAGMRTCTG